MTMEQPLLEARSVSKRYGNVAALQDVSIAFAPGKIHAVLGENGAGKSTLMGILAGFIVPDSGSCSLEGHALPVGRPFECKRAGIGMVHQHFTLVPEFTIAENLALSQLDGLFRIVRPKDLAAPALRLAGE